MNSFIAEKETTMKLLHNYQALVTCNKIAKGNNNDKEENLFNVINLLEEYKQLKKSTKRKQVEINNNNMNANNGGDGDNNSQ